MDDQTIQEQIQDWVEDYPDGYLQKSFSKIAAEIGCSVSSVDRYLVYIIAERDDCFPSEVVEKRVEAGFKRGPRKISERDKADIEKYHKQGLEPRDIAYIVGVSPVSVKKYLSKK